MRALPALAGLALLLSGCAGTTPLQACVDHSVEEGLPESTAEQACREAGFEG